MVEVGGMRKIKIKTIAILVLAVITVEGIIVALKDNCFFYKTPEEAFSAAYFGRSKAHIVLIGEDTAFIVGSNSRKNLSLILEKKENGWRVGNKLLDETSTLLVAGNGSGIVSHRKGTLDYYVEVIFPFGGEHVVSDNCGSSFQELRNEDGSVCYFAWISGWQENYLICCGTD